MSLLMFVPCSSHWEPTPLSPPPVRITRGFVRIPARCAAVRFNYIIMRIWYSHVSPPAVLNGLPIQEGVPRRTSVMFKRTWAAQGVRGKTLEVWKISVDSNDWATTSSFKRFVSQLSRPVFFVGIQTQISTVLSVLGADAFYMFLIPCCI